MLPIAIEPHSKLDRLFGPDLAPDDHQGRLKRLGERCRARFFLTFTSVRFVPRPDRNGIVRRGLMLCVEDRPGLRDFLGPVFSKLRMIGAMAWRSLRDQVEVIRRAERDRTLSSFDRHLVTAVRAILQACSKALAAGVLAQAVPELLPRVMSAGGWDSLQVPLI